MVAGGHLHGQRVRIEDTIGYGIGAWDRDTLVVLQSLHVGGTRAEDCFPLGCGEGSPGVGLGVFGARVEVDYFRIERSQLVATTVAEDGCVELASGTLAHNPIGINIEVEGFDTGKVLDDVEFRDNEANFASVELPVPRPPAFDGL